MALVIPLGTLALTFLVYRRFAGDSGDGMQVTGEQFTSEAAWAGNDISTLPNFPAEIRAPAGTLFGVSSFQLHWSSTVRPHTGAILNLADDPAAERLMTPRCALASFTKRKT